MPPPRTIIHVDMDCFFVSVERLLDPSLIGKPVIVGGPSDSRSVVSSASYEARKFGVHSAMPCSQARRLCPQAIFVSGSYGRYGEYSRAIRETLESLTPLVQMASQDEAYLDMTGTERLWGSPVEMGDRVRRAIWEKVKLPSSVGISSTKTVSKIASDLCKPRGLLWVPAGTEKEFLRPLPVGKMPGIGKKTQEALKKLGVLRLGDLQSLGTETCVRLFGKHGASLHARAMGTETSVVVTEEDVKSISNELTFDRDTNDAEYLSGVLCALSEKVAHRMRRAELSGRTVQIKFRYANFETHTAARTLDGPTQDQKVIFRTALELLESKRDPERPLRLIGVGCTNLEGECMQLDLLDAELPDLEKRDRLNHALDEVRARYGEKIIGNAAGKEARGQMISGAFGPREGKKSQNSP